VSRADQLLNEGAREILGRELSDTELESLRKYREMLIKWQRVQRLVGSTDAVWISEALFLDSLLFLRVLPPEVRSVADLGSGAGLPGIPIKIVRPEIDVTLIESRERRISFLSAVVRELHLPGIRVLGARAEDLVDDTGPRFGAVVMRCAGNPGRLLALAARLVDQGGTVVVAGPPEPRALSVGQSVEVPGVRRGQTRRFAVLTT
jgi:16S rRNA (guanine527-N7)-methyltransferase